MTQIMTAENQVIEFSSDTWRLSLLSEDQEPRTVAEASTGRNLRYNSHFANRLRLPEGALPNDQIKQVIVGWSDADQGWHLGLLLEQDLSQSRGSRWCELAHWTQADAAPAQQAGNALANILGLSFRLIEPTPSPEAEVRALPAPPLQFGIWSLVREGETLAFHRAARWMQSRVWRVVWYSFWAVVYLALSIATLTTKLALPNSGMLLPDPKILPYLGIAAAVVIIGIVLKTLYDIFTEAGKIVINPQTQTVTGMSGSRQVWEKSAAEVQAVYVSQVLTQRGNKRTLHHAELNLHLISGKFFNLLVQEREEERTEQRATSDTLREEITPLTAQEVDTDLQAAGVYLAKALGDLPCWYDQRTQ